MATKAEAQEFSRIIQYFAKNGVYPENANPKMLAAAIQFEKDRVLLEEKMAARKAKRKS
jgi:hypothetical protein